MKNKSYSQNQIKEKDLPLVSSVIGMYEMLAQAQPDLNYDHSSLFDKVWKNAEAAEESNE